MKPEFWEQTGKYGEKSAVKEPSQNTSASKTPASRRSGRGGIEPGRGRRRDDRDRARDSNHDGGDAGSDSGGHGADAGGGGAPLRCTGFPIDVGFSKLSFQ